GSLIAGASIVAALFSAQQYVNFFWGFQVQFMLVYCAAVGALFALLNSTEDRRDRVGRIWFAGGIGLGGVGTFSMGNGLLTWPVLLLAAFWLRIPLRRILIIAVAAILAGLIYFQGWHWVSIQSRPMLTSAYIYRIGLFWLTNLGAPIYPLAV